MSEAKRVLVVEDNDAQRAVVTAVLRRNPDLQVDEARTGTEGLDKIAEGSYAVIVLDMMLPDFDGLTFIQTLRETQPAEAPSIIAVTAASESAIPTPLIEGTYGDLVRAVMRKPVNQKELADTVALWAAGVIQPGE
ncbi:MAG TPA: response regulator [Thermoanaerobaculia bacterium]|nr:response regulator [Thermoanaerobaculia bacterium]